MNLSIILKKEICDIRVASIGAHNVRDRNVSTALLVQINFNRTSSDEVVDFDRLLLTIAQHASDGLIHGGVVDSLSRRALGEERREEDDMVCHEEITIRYQYSKQSGG